MNVDKVLTTAQPKGPRRGTRVESPIRTQFERTDRTQEDGRPDYGTRPGCLEVGTEWRPDGCVLVGLMHGTHADVSGPDDVQAGDHIYAVVSGKARKALVKLLD